MGLGRRRRRCRLLLGWPPRAAFVVVGPAKHPPPPPLPSTLLLLVLLLAAQNAAAAVATATGADAATTVSDALDIAPEVERLVRRWAPLVWLAPGERFFPSGVSEFLHHVTPRRRRSPRGCCHDFSDSDSDTWFLVTNTSIDELVQDESSFLFGRDPSGQSPVPVYALVTPCSSGAGIAQAKGATPRFHVTYWMFYPFSQGKAVCSVDMGPLGLWPLPLLGGFCMGSFRDFGSHVGDWEHFSLFFEANSSAPSALYLSAHDAGAYYRPSNGGRRFVFERQEVRRGLLQRGAAFPATVRLTLAPPARSHSSLSADDNGRLELFAARGSHGLWAAPGTHRYVRLPRLYDHSGYGIPWATWRALQVMSSGNGRKARNTAADSHGKSTAPGWMAFRGRWGNPRSKCHPLARLGLALCQFTDGPTGIPMKEPHFYC